MSEHIRDYKEKSFLSQLLLAIGFMCFLMAEGIVVVLILHKPAPHAQLKLFLYMLPLFMLLPLLRCLWGYRTIKREVIGKDFGQHVLAEIRYVFASICVVVYAVIVLALIAVR